MATEIGGLLILLISRRMPVIHLDALGLSTVRVLAASLLMGLPMAWLAGLLDPLLRPRGRPGRAVLLVVCVGIAAASAPWPPGCSAPTSWAFCGAW